MNGIEQWLRRKPACHARAYSLVRILCVFVINLDGLCARALGCGIGHKLGMATLLRAHEPKDCFLHSGTNGEQAVVLEKSELLVTKLVGNVFAFFLGEYDAVELIIQDVVLVNPSAKPPTEHRSSLPRKKRKSPE